MRGDAISGGARCNRTGGHKRGSEPWTGGPSSRSQSMIVSAIAEGRERYLTAGS
jgi:hypothetical protein